MTTKRRPIKRAQTAQITPAAIERWQHMQALQRACTCPPASSAPWFGPAFNSADPECMARYKLYEIERAHYEAQRAACKACPQRMLEHDALLGELGIKLDVWELDIYDRHSLVAALDTAVKEAQRAKRAAKSAAGEPVTG